MYVYLIIETDLIQILAFGGVTSAGPSKINHSIEMIQPLSCCVPAWATSLHDGASHGTDVSWRPSNEDTTA